METLEELDHMVQVIKRIPHGGATIIEVRSDGTKYCRQITYEQLIARELYKEGYRRKN